MFDDEPRPPAKGVTGAGAHVPGEPLDDLSIHDLDERVALLRAEIERLEAAKRAKLAASHQAASVFKP